MHPADASNPRICLISGLVLIACTCCTGHSRWAHGQTLIILNTHGESHHLGVTEPSVAVGVDNGGNPNKGLCQIPTVRYLKDLPSK